MRKKNGFILAALLVIATLTSAQDDGRDNELSQGIEFYEKGLYLQALEKFQNITLNPSLDASLGDAYFWLAKSQLLVANLDGAEKNLEFFLLNYPSHKHTIEAAYLKGRLLFLQTDYESCIQAYQNFIDKNADSPFVPNAYFWIGESLFQLGRFNESQRIFTFLLQEFPRSVKVEAVGYRVKLIDLKQREEELLKLLLLSHEEALKSLEEYQRKERTYEQAISAYQRKLATVQPAAAEAPIEAPTTVDTAAIEEQLKGREAEIARLNDRIESLIEQIKTLQEAAEQRPGQASTEIESPATVPAVDSGELQRYERLLEAKQGALELKAYLLELSQRGDD